MSIADLVVIGGGQAGLATAYVAAKNGLSPVVVDAAAAAGGSWPSYHDSLTLFSPAGYSSLPGMAFPGDPRRYPRRDEVVEYLRTYAGRLPALLRFGERVERVTVDGERFVLSTASGTMIEAQRVVAATGGFATPYRPPLPGLDSFTGTVLHAADYRQPGPFAGARVVVVGGGNSAVQIAVELAVVATVSLATRRPLRWQAQHILGRDFHWWLVHSRLDRSGLGPRLFAGSVPVIDDGRYRTAVRAGRPDHRPLFTRLDGAEAVWADGTREAVDVVLLATGYRPSLSFLRDTPALGPHGEPLHYGGLSTTLGGLGYVGLERQRSFASATLRGVGHDADHVLRALLRQRSVVTV